MATQAEQMSELQRKNLDAAMKLAQLSINNSQRIMQIQVDTARSLFDESVTNARELTAVKDPAKLVDLRARYAQLTTERMLACAREIAQISAETQAAFGKMVGEQLSGGSTDLMESVRKMLSGMPVASTHALGSMQEAVDAARSAFEQVAKASKEAFAHVTQAVKPGVAADPDDEAPAPKPAAKKTAAPRSRKS